MRRTSWAVGLLWLCATPAGATPALTAPTEAAVALLADVRNPTTTEAMLRNLATLAQTCAWARRYELRLSNLPYPLYALHCPKASEAQKCEVLFQTYGCD